MTHLNSAATVELISTAGEDTDLVAGVPHRPAVNALFDHFPLPGVSDAPLPALSTLS
jgi:hypothetical protein